MSKNPYQRYKQTSIETAGKEKILLMLYEGAIKFTKLAILAAEKKQIADRATNICKVYDIILELNNTLDHKVGGDLAAQLEQLYTFLTDQLSKANLTGEAEPLRAVLRILETLYDGWKQAVDQLKKQEQQKRAE